MVQGISFKAISTDPTIKGQDTTFAQPQANAVTPSASTEVKSDKFEKKGKTGKTIVGILAFAAAAATALVVLRRKLPSFKDFKLPEINEGEKHKILDKVVDGLAKAADFIDGKIVKPVVTFVNEKIIHRAGGAATPETPPVTPSDETAITEVVQ